MTFDFLASPGFGLLNAGVNYFLGQRDYNQALKDNRSDFEAARNQLSNLRSSGMNLLNQGYRSADGLIANSIETSMGRVNSGFDQGQDYLSALLGKQMGTIGASAKNLNSLLRGIGDRGKEALASRTQEVRDAYSGLGADFRQQGGEILNRLRSGTDDLNRRFDERTSRIMANLEGLGEQERADILERGGERETSAAQNVARRGLSGTGAVSAVRQSVARETEKDLSRQADTIRRQKIGVESSLTGEALGARERGRNIDTATAANLLATGSGIGERGVSAVAAALGDQIQGNTQFDMARVNLGRETRDMRLAQRGQIMGAMSGNAIARGGALADLGFRGGMARSGLAERGAMAKSGFLRDVDFFDVGLQERAIRPLPADPRQQFQNQLGQIISGIQQRQLAESMQPSGFEQWGMPIINGVTSIGSAALGNPALFAGSGGGGGGATDFFGGGMPENVLGPNGMQAFNPMMMY